MKLMALPDPMIGYAFGRYIVRERIAQGGMGAVYSAEHELLGTKKVVKLLLDRFANNETIRKRFEREALAASKLSHKNIITIDDFGPLPNGQLYLMMPYLEGRPLSALREEYHKLDCHRVLQIMVQVCSALHHAHQVGYVHRDLKPDNIFITKTRENPYHVTLIDLGIARDLAVMEGRTQTGLTMGTPGYMAVEQYGHAREATALADVYSAAIITWELVTGERPWGRHSDVELYQKQLTEAPVTPPPALMPDAWERLLRRALSPQLDRRPQSIRELAIGLASAVAPIPPHIPGGTDIIAAYARDLLLDAMPLQETARGPSSSDISPRLWPPRHTEPAEKPTAETPVQSVPDVSIHIEPGEDLLSTVRDRAPTRGDASPRVPWPVSMPVADQSSEPRAVRVAPRALHAAGATPSPTTHVLKPASKSLRTAFALILLVAVISGGGLVVYSRVTRTRASFPQDGIGSSQVLLSPTGPGDGSIADARSEPAVSAPIDAMTPTDAGTHIDATMPIDAPSPPPPASVDAGAKIAPHVTNAALPKGDLQISIDPFANVWIDGVSYGPTPIQTNLPVGTHHVTLVNTSKNITKHLTVKITTTKPTVIEDTW